MISTSTEKIDLLSLLPDEIGEFMSELGEPKYRAKQIFTQLHRGKTLPEMTDLPKSLREKLEKTCVDKLPKIETKLVSKIDGTVKYLWRLYDGNFVESVFMRYKHGNTVCISTQVGCRMGCAFCASTIGGKVRDLAASEMIGQIISSELDLGETVSGVVMMGIGEPLDNYDNSLRFLRLVNLPDGLNIGYRHISLSTCGVADRIRDLAKEDLPITLSISLHAFDDETRSALMPINKKWNIHVLLAAAKEYFEATGRRISFEYTLIRGKNDSGENAAALAKLLNSSLRSGGSMPIHVNLIPVNPVKEKSFSSSDKNTVNAFAAVLEKSGISATVRRKLGSDINASCGQLRRKSMENGKKNPFL